MNGTERTQLAILMHNTAASYVEGTINPAHAVEIVKKSLVLIDRHKATLAEQIQRYHDSFMQAMKNQSEEDFMLKVLSQCCVYRAELF